MHESNIYYMNKNFTKFVNKLFESREMANAYHFNKKNYEYHVSLEFYYEKINKLYDKLVEAYQGKYGVMDEDYELIISTSKNDNPIEYFKELATFVETNTEKAIDKKDTFLLNVVDEITLLIYQTLFKLQYLK